MVKDILSNCENTPELLKKRQSYSLKLKIRLSQDRIKEWYEYWNGQVYVAFSGGKDSTVLLHLVRKLYPEVVGVFSNTGLEYPEIKGFVKTFGNIDTIKPKLSYRQVVEKYGYPVISKFVARQIRTIQNPTKKNKATRKLYLTGEKIDGTQSKYSKLPKKHKILIDAPFKVSEQCCDILKKNPFKDYVKKTKKKAIVGTMAEDSFQRKMAYLKTGCNSFSGDYIKSTPLSFWLQKDI